MTDTEIATAMSQVARLVSSSRATWQGSGELPEQDAALVVMRRAMNTQKALQDWITQRALRLQLERRSG